MGHSPLPVNCNRQSLIISPHSAILVLLCTIGLAWRVYLGSYPGFGPDVRTYQGWAVGEKNWPHEIVEFFPCDYPPLYPCWLRTLGWLHGALGLPGDMRQPILWPEFQALQARRARQGLPPDPVMSGITAQPIVQPSWEASRPIILTVKSLPIIADIVAAVLFFVVAGRGGWGLVAAGLWLLLPAVWYNSAYWGQTDTLLSFLLVLTIWMLLKRCAVWLGALMAMCVLFKAQSVVAIFVLLAALVAQRRVWRPRWPLVSLGAASACVAVALWSAAAGYTGQWRRGFLGAVGHYPETTHGAMNAWWLASRSWDRPVRHADFPRDDVPLVAGLTARHIGVGVFGLLFGLILWRVHRAGWSDVAVSLGAATAIMAFVMVCTEMHERYAVPVLGPLILAGCRRRRLLIVAAIVSIPIWLNCVALLPWLEARPDWVAHWVNRFARSQHDILRTSVAVANVASCSLLIVLLWRLGPNVPLPCHATRLPGPCRGWSRRSRA